MMMLILKKMISSNFFFFLLKKLEKTEDGWRLMAVDAEKINPDSAPKPLYWVCYNIPLS